MKTRPSPPQNGKINIITLGCSKNLVDSEVLLSQLRANDRVVSHESTLNDSETVVINTCGFIDKAKQESIDTIQDYLQRKRDGLVKNVYVTGCLSQRYRDQLIEDMPGVDGFFGTQDLPNLLGALNADYKHELLGERQVVTDSHYAYLKISEGCNRGCSFCAIPLMRGRHASREIEFLVNEATYLVSKGVKEIMLIAQDLTYYGLDIYGKKRLDDLLRALSDIDGLHWIRLHYAYPSGFPEEILPVMRERANICNYLDMPLQHISTAVLKKMRRAIDKQRTIDLISRIRDAIPGIAIRTTLLVGHPGETDSDQEELLDFLDETQLDRVGVFTYSHEEGTHSHSYKDDVPEEIKQARYEEVMLLQQEISRDLNQERVGTVMKTLIDRIEDNAAIGRTEYDSPEVDNTVRVAGANCRAGEFIQVRITEGLEYDLVGERVDG